MHGQSELMRGDGKREMLVKRSERVPRACICFACARGAPAPGSATTVSRRISPHSALGREDARGRSYPTQTRSRVGEALCRNVPQNAADPILSNDDDARNTCDGAREVTEGRHAESVRMTQGRASTPHASLHYGECSVSSEAHKARKCSAACRRARIYVCRGRCGTWTQTG